MTDIAVTTTLAGALVNGLTDPPEITITRLDTDADVVSGSAMSDTGANGKYKFVFTPLAGIAYSFLIDSDPNATSQTDIRYFDGAFNGKLDEMWQDRGLDPSNPKTITEVSVAIDYDEDIGTIHKDVVKTGSTTTITRT